MLADNLYLSPILDMYNDEIVLYDIFVSPNYRQITNMLDQAFTRYNNLNGHVVLIKDAVSDATLP